MRLFACDEAGSDAKMAGVVRAFPDAWGGRVLDVGCRARQLANALPPATTFYCGVDLSKEGDVVTDATALSFPNRSFDTVTALDVLEHTDDIYATIAELYRVAGHRLIVCLPNAYELRLRIGYLRGRIPTAKYGLPLERPRDRHRWLFGFDEARAFVKAACDRHGFRVESEGGLVGPRRAARPMRILTERWPGLFAKSYLASLVRERAD